MQDNFSVGVLLKIRARILIMAVFGKAARRDNPNSRENETA